MKYRTTITIEAFYTTDGDPNDVVNELLDRFAEVNTDDLNLFWDDCNWENYHEVDTNAFVELGESNEPE